AVRQTFNLDYVHWREQLQGVSDYFSTDGWKWFLQALQGTNNLKTLVDLQMVSSATITGAPQLLDHAVLGGRYAWKISIPVLVTYTSVSKNFNLPATVTLVVIRMPITEAPDRIAINNFIVSTGGSS
ncbi:MAG TPA: DotI/IcmL/TraM family protein, partial [Coxiellaceae bacterium]|nr:DotI/IcmL/TraM family protein [Coxiellaceae bacterium]